jgi:ABC-2 type transport system ATP-binding protein
MSAVVVDRLGKRYGEFTALRDVSFAADAGQVIAILGPNGAGKTTTIEILEGFLEPSAGTVRVLGSDPRRGGRAWRARIGLVLQSTSLDRQLTVAEVLTAYAAAYPRPRSVADVLSAVDLAGQANTRIGALSGGGQRRVDLGLGIIGRPELLFLDEPTTGLDPQARRHVWSVVRELTAAGTTVLLSTHYLEEAQQLADRVIVLADGRVVADTTPADLRRRGAAAVIRLPVVDGAPRAGLPASVAGRLKPEGGELVFSSRDVAADLAALLDWAHRYLIDLSALQVGPPSLEDAYLSLTQTPTEETVLTHD